MKILISALLLTGLLASCAPATVINSAGVEVPDASLEAEYYQNLGKHRKATVLRRDKGFDFISNAYRVREQNDEFRELSSTWYTPQSGFNTTLGVMGLNSSNFELYFAKSPGTRITPFLYAEYYGDDWLFFDTISVKAGDKKAVVLASGRYITDRKVLDGGLVRERYNETEGAKAFLRYMKGVPDKAPISFRLISSSNQSFKSYNYLNNKPVIDEMLALIR